MLKPTETSKKVKVFGKKLQKFQIVGKKLQKSHSFEKFIFASHLNEKIYLRTGFKIELIMYF